MGSSQLDSLYKSLTEEWKKGETRNLGKIEKLVMQLKAEFVTQGLAGVVSAEANTAFLQKQREVAEISVQLYTLKKDMESFQRVIGQLKSSYAAFANTLDKQIGESTAKYHMLGLDLMCYLAQNDLPSFHMELERIPPKQTTASPYIAFPVGLEQALMEGAYNKIFLSKANLPSPYYTFFMDILLETVRGEIAKCMEKAYKNLSCQEAARLLFLDGPDSQKKVLDYGTKRNWELSGDKRSFIFETDRSRAEAGMLDSRRLVCQNIYYAKQLEMIP